MRCATSAQLQSKTNSPSLLPFTYDGATATSSLAAPERQVRRQPARCPRRRSPSPRARRATCARRTASSPRRACASHVAAAPRARARARAACSVVVAGSTHAGCDGGLRVLAHEDEPGVHPAVLLLRAADGHVRRDAAHHVDHPVVDEAPEARRVRHDRRPCVGLLLREHRVVDVDLARVGRRVRDVVARAR